MPTTSKVNRVWLFVTPWTVAHQAPPSMECSRQEYWSGLPFPSSGIIIMNIQDWFPLGWTGLIHIKLVAVHGTLKSFLQHHSSKHQILWHSAFFMVQLSHPYMTTGKTIVLTRWTFVGKVMSLLFNAVKVGHSFSSKEQASFNFMAAVTICSDFWNPQK